MKWAKTTLINESYDFSWLNKRKEIKKRRNDKKDAVFCWKNNQNKKSWKFNVFKVQYASCNWIQTFFKKKEKLASWEGGGWGGVEQSVL